MRDQTTFPPDTSTLVHPETGALLTRQRRMETVSYMGYSREVEVEAFYPENDGDAILVGSAIRWKKRSSKFAISTVLK